MGTTAAKLQAALDSKEAIRQAIIAKDVAVPVETPLSQYPSRIAAIEGGGQVLVNPHRVRFFDYDGTILKEEMVEHGETATAPALPTHEYLVFNSWNNDFDEITEDLNVGALYDTVDDATYLFVEIGFAPTTSLSPQITLYNNSGTLTVEWGDGSSSVHSTIGLTYIAHTYLTKGRYTIKVTSTGNYDLSGKILGDSWKRCLLRAFVGNKVTTIGSDVFRESTSLRFLSLPPSINSMGDSAFRGRSTLYHLNIPRGVSTISPYLFYDNVVLVGVVFPSSITTIGTYAFYSCYCFAHGILPNTVNTIGSYAFYACYALEINRLPALLSGAIDTSTFHGCTRIAFEEIPEGVTSIGSNAFNGCRAVATLRMPSTLLSIGEAGLQTMITLKTLILNEGLVSIGNSWLSNNAGITSITVPSTVALLGQYAFFWQALSEIIMLPTSPPTIGNNVVIPSHLLPPTIRIYVPDASLSAYKDATNWNVWSTYMYPISERPT